MGEREQTAPLGSRFGTLDRPNLLVHLFYWLFFFTSRLCLSGVNGYCITRHFVSDETILFGPQLYQVTQFELGPYARNNRAQCAIIEPIWSLQCGWEQSVRTSNKCDRRPCNQGCYGSGYRAEPGRGIKYDRASSETYQLRRHVETFGAGNERIALTQGRKTNPFADVPKNIATRERILGDTPR
jgi:hypothetical protein